MKKIFNTPAASVLKVEAQDILTTSGSFGNSTDTQLIQQRQQWEDYDDLDEEL